MALGRRKRLLGPIHMTAKEDLQALDARIAAMEEQSNALAQQSYQLSMEREAVLKRYVLEAKLLHGTVWAVQLHWQKPDLVLNCHQKLPEEAMSLLRSGWHSSFELEDGATINFDDNDISLRLKPEVNVGQMITKYGLVIRTDEVVNQIILLTAQQEALQRLLQQIRPA